MIIDINTRTAIEIDHSRLKDLYARWGNAFQHCMDDHYFLAEYKGNIIAAIRLAFENSIFVVRSLYVQKEFRGCGVARKLLHHVEKALGSAEVYCLALESHEKLLGAIGLQKIVGLTAPAFLTARRKGLQEEGKNAILMKRSVGVEVRPLLAEDLELAMDLISEFKLPEVQKLTKNDIRNIYSRISSSGGAVVGAFQNNVMVGTCTVNICANLSWSGRPYSIIENVIVTKEAQGQGIGKYLLLFSKHFAASKNCHKVALMTHDTNVADTSLYTSAGFTDDKVGYQTRFAV
jgi:GNAT superfamily N-acetyltransferase